MNEITEATATIGVGSETGPILLSEFVTRQGMAKVEDPSTRKYTVILLKDGDTLKCRILKFTFVGKFQETWLVEMSSRSERKVKVLANNILATYQDLT